MSAVLKLPRNNGSKNIYLIYDFKQVKDSILIVMYVDKLNSWKKIFINYENGAWDIDILAFYTDDVTCAQIRSKLNFILSRHQYSDEQKALNLEQSMEDNAAFILGITTT